MKIKEVWKNYKLCKKYPAIKCDKFYRYTELDLIPQGWNDLLLTMLDEIKNTLGNKVYENYRFFDLKEKYGMLRVIHTCVNNRVFSNIFTYDEEEMLEKIETKYEDISAQTCGGCGRSLRDGEFYLCKECINEFERAVNK